MLKIGSHVSMSSPKYFVKSAMQTINNEANALMIYTGAPQNTRRTAIEKLNIAQGWELLNQHKINYEDLIIHAPYIINLANTINESTADIAKQALLSELKRTYAFNSKVLVLHPGAHVKAGMQIGLDAIVKNLDLVFDQLSIDEPNNDVTIALEIMAGKGTECCTSFEQVQYVISHSKYAHRLGVCFDTCHIYDAGYDLKNDLEQVLADFDAIIGLDKIKVLHINDSKFGLASHKDRHANIGYGQIGFEAMLSIIYHDKFSNVAKILETPYVGKDDKRDFEPYKFEIAAIRNKEFEPNLIDKVIKFNQK